MKLLILGGGVFLGAAALQSALARGTSVTVFNRGQSRTDWPAGVEVLCGDRGSALDKLSGRRWDAVIDTCAYVPAEVRASATLLRDSGIYLFVSSISAYASFRNAPVRETDALADFSGTDPTDRAPELYGVQKAACEAEVQAVFGARALIVRPGLIVGPGDRTGRFSHWPWRVAAGGEMLVPAAPADTPLQFIDVRDLGDWMLRLLADGTTGVFNATGPNDGPDCTWETLLTACADETRTRGGEPADVVTVDEGFLIAQQVGPWSELPLWVPSTDPEYTGFARVALERAVTAGLRTRPLRDTIGAVLDEGQPPPDDRRRAGKLTPEREAELIARWRAR